MALRVCNQPGCPTLTDKPGKCAEHRRQADKARGTRQQRGYDQQHQVERARWSPLVATGNVKCWRCREHIAAGEPWDLGHDDRDRDKHRGPEHVACNRATAGRS